MWYFERWKILITSISLKWDTFNFQSINKWEHWVCTNYSTVKSVTHFQEPGGKIDTHILHCQLPFQTNMTHNFSLFWGTSSTIAGGMKHNMVVLLGVYLKKNQRVDYNLLIGIRNIKRLLPSFKIIWVKVNIHMER